MSNDEEINICGVLVHARQQALEQVKASLISLPGTEVHAASDDGRLVVTVEDRGKYRCVDTITQFNDVEGVISTSLIYQYTDHDPFTQESAS
jgi:nitrate reductase NapD